MNQKALSFILSSPKQTLKYARALGERLTPGDFLMLEGPLGAGKSHFVKGLAKGLGVPEHVHVSSPSFSLINEYPGRLPLYHIDVYRLEKEEELCELGISEMAESGGVIAIEWISKFPSYIPKDCLEIFLSFGTRKNQRILTLSPQGESANARVLSLLDWIEKVKKPA